MGVPKCEFIGAFDSSRVGVGGKKYTSPPSIPSSVGEEGVRRPEDF
jgi:hypothetical protein